MARTNQETVATFGEALHSANISYFQNRANVTAENGFILATKKLLDDMKFLWSGIPNEVDRGNIRSKKIADYVFYDINNILETLSDSGGVTRGICKMDEQDNLTEVVETKNIVKTAEGAMVDGVALDTDSLVSMNMWGLTPDFLEILETGFARFFEKEVPADPLKAEYLIPTFIGELLAEGKMAVKVLRTNDTWYGMTYKDDVMAVRDSFKEMFEKGIYKADLFSDL